MVFGLPLDSWLPLCGWVLGGVVLLFSLVVSSERKKWSPGIFKPTVSFGRKEEIESTHFCWPSDVSMFLSDSWFSRLSIMGCKPNFKDS